MGIRTKGAAWALMSALAVQGASAAPVAPPAVAPKADPAAVATLSSSVSSAIAKLPGTASIQDVEAAATFAIDQAQQPLEVVQASLTDLIAQAKTRKIRLALTNVLRARRGLAGTGALRSGVDATLAAGPSVGGGGGTNYTTGGN